MSLTDDSKRRLVSSFMRINLQPSNGNDGWGWRTLSREISEQNLPATIDDVHSLLSLTKYEWTSNAKKSKHGSCMKTFMERLGWKWQIDRMAKNCFIGSKHGYVMKHVPMVRTTGEAKEILLYASKYFGFTEDNVMGVTSTEEVIGRTRHSGGVHGIAEQAIGSVHDDGVQHRAFQEEDEEEDQNMYTSNRNQPRMKCEGQFAERDLLLEGGLLQTCRDYLPEGQHLILSHSDPKYNMCATATGKKNRPFSLTSIRCKTVCQRLNFI